MPDESIGEMEVTTEEAIVWMAEVVVDVLREIVLHITDRTPGSRDNLDMLVAHKASEDAHDLWHHYANGAEPERAPWRDLEAWVYGMPDDAGELSPAWPDVKRRVLAVIDEYPPNKEDDNG